jgi:hypothetical protein
VAVYGPGALALVLLSYVHLLVLLSFLASPSREGLTGRLLSRKTFFHLASLLTSVPAAVTFTLWTLMALGKLSIRRLYFEPGAVCQVSGAVWVGYLKL